jgi:hypothetical protein
MNIEKLQKHVEKLESFAKALAAAKGDYEKDAKARESARQSMKNFATELKVLLMDYLKENKMPVRPGQLYRDAAGKSFVPGDFGGDNLIIKWGGNVTPASPKEIQDEAARFLTAAEKLLPVLKAYQKE